MAVMLLPIDGLPEVRPGDDLAALLIDAIERSRMGLKAADVVVVCQKVISKAEGRVVDLATVEPGERAQRFAESYDKDARVVEVALREATDVVRMGDGHLITRTGAGWVAANSGIDRSNQADEDCLTLLPEVPDASAARLRASLSEHFAVPVAVIVTDTWGRAWRLGQIDFAIGAAGIQVLEDHSGRLDRNGRPLEHTMIAVADQMAAAAGLLMEKSAGVAAVLVRGARYSVPEGAEDRGARSMVRPPEDDLFR